MIEYITKDITTVENGIVAHGCNCQGRMGSGVALAVKNTWPNVYNQYISACANSPNKSKLLGTIQAIPITTDLIVVNMFTQMYYGNDGQKYASVLAIEQSLEKLFAFAEAVKKDVYMPKIGCGLGGLNWKHDVEPVMKHLADKYHVNVFVCDYK